MLFSRTCHCKDAYFFSLQCIWPHALNDTLTVRSQQKLKSGGPAITPLSWPFIHCL